MKTIALKVWHEPAVAIGFVTSAGLTVLNVLHGTFDVQAVVEVLAPLASALGIRQTVTPVTRG